MPRLSAQQLTTAKVDVELSVTLRTKLKKILARMATRREEIAKLTEKQDGDKVSIEEAFADEDQHAALAEGVRIPTPAGEVPLKIVSGSTSVFDKKGFMRKHKLTQADFDEFTSSKPKKEYLGITWPKDRDEDDA